MLVLRFIGSLFLLGAVIALTRQMAVDYTGLGIRVNCLTPAAVETDIFKQMTEAHIQFMLSKIPVGRFGKIEEVARFCEGCVERRDRPVDREVEHTEGHHGGGGNWRHRTGWRGMSLGCSYQRQQHQESKLLNATGIGEHHRDHDRFCRCNEPIDSRVVDSTNVETPLEDREGGECERQFPRRGKGPEDGSPGCTKSGG